MVFRSPKNENQGWCGFVAAGSIWCNCIEGYINSTHRKVWNSQCLDRKVKRQRKGLQAPFETGDYNGVSEELQNLHGPNANRNSAKSAVLQVRRVQAISGYMEREGNDPRGKGRLCSWTVGPVWVRSLVQALLWLGRFMAYPTGNVDGQTEGGSPESDLESLAETAVTDEWRANGRGISFRAICPHRSVEGNNYFDNAQLHSLLTETFFAHHQGRAWPNLNPTER